MGVRLGIQVHAALIAVALLGCTLPAVRCDAPSIAAAAEETGAPAAAQAQDTSGPRPGSRTYRTEADFRRGRSVNVACLRNPDRLELSPDRLQRIFPFIWIPNNNGSVSKVDVNTGRELARYRTGPADEWLRPSRTTIDLDGNCWVGNRSAGSVVKIGLLESGAYVDRNRNGQPDTSRDVNGDGNITGDELLPWGEDECVLFEVVVIPGREGTFVPGTYQGGYARNEYDPGPRSLAIDSQNNLWVGGYGSKLFHYVEGRTGTLLVTGLNTGETGHNPYGAVIDANGILWSSGAGTGRVMRMEPGRLEFRALNLGHWSYGLALDYLGHLFVTGWGNNQLSRINTETGGVDWTRAFEGGGSPKGAVCTRDNDLWTANYGAGTVGRYDNEGHLRATIQVGSSPTGMAMDANNKVWVCDDGDEYIWRIDPATNQVDLKKTIVESGGHYSYSDMTGIVARDTQARRGSWAVQQDSLTEGCPWESVTWKAEVPQGASLTVAACVSEDGRAWSPWQPLQSGKLPSEFPTGEFIRVCVSFAMGRAEASPRLYELTIQPRTTLTAKFRLEKDGKPVPGAGKGEIRAWERVGDTGDWDPVEVVDLREDNELAKKRAVMLALDISGSMALSLYPDDVRARRGDRLSAVKQGACALVGELHPDQDAVGLVTFESKTTTVQPVGMVTAKLKAGLTNTINGLPLGTGTMLYDGVLLALGELERFSQASGWDHPRGVVLLTDGRDTDSRHTATEVVAECRRTGIPVFICGLCIRGQMADELRAFSEATGGVYAPAATLEEIERAFQDAWRLLAANYVVEWVTSLPPGTAGQVRIQYHGRRGEFEAAIRPIQAGGK